MCGQRIEDASQRLLGYFEIAFDCVCAVHKHLRLDDRHQVPFLTKRCVARQRLRVRVDAGARGNSVADRDHRPPLGKARAELSIFGQSLTQSVETLGNFLAVKIRHRLGAFVHFDPRDDPLLFQRFYETAPVASLCRIVSSKRITPLINSPAPAVVNKSSRYARRFSSVEGTLMLFNRFSIVPELSSAARIPFPGATSFLATDSKVSVLIILS